MTSSQDPFATRVYVVGEVLISCVALSGALVVLFLSADEGSRLAASGLLSAVTVFWFSRRAAEQSSNVLATLADGKLTQLLESQQQIQSRVDSQVTLMASLARAAEAPSAAGASPAPVGTPAQR